MTLLDIARRVAAFKPRPFVVPVPYETARIDVFTLQDGNIPVSRQLVIPENSPYPLPDWYLVRPAGDKIAHIDRPAHPMEILDYLRELRRFFVIAVAQVNADSWLVVPENLSVGRRIGWNGEPREVHLVTENPNPLDVLIARVMGDHLLFDCLADGYGFPTQKAKFALENDPGMPLGQTWTAAVGILRSLQHQMPLRPVERPDGLEDLARWHLDYVGANLTGLESVGRDIRITWEYDGAEFSASFDETLRLRQAPICLAGTDAQHNLSTIVSVMQQARRLHRFDLSEEYYL